MHPHLELKTARSPESLIPPAKNETTPSAAAESLERHLAALHPSRRAAYLETAYIRAVKPLPDNTAKNYIPPMELAAILSRWMPESLDKARKIAYLKTLHQGASASVQESASGHIHDEIQQIKSIFKSAKENLF